MIVKYVNEKKKDWDVFAYNTTKHASSLYSPFKVMFGRNAILPVELSYDEEGENLLNNL